MQIAAEADGWSRLRPIALEEGTTAHAQVYSCLRHAMISGYFRPGEEISLRRAAAVLGTSVTPIREALKQLESDGALEVFGGNRVQRVPILTPAELHDIRDIRINLEGFAASLAVDGIGPQQMRLISNACSMMQRATEEADVDLFLESNWRFHSLIYRAAQRPVLMGLIEGMWLRVGPLLRIAMNTMSHYDRSMVSHHAALDAIEKRDGEALKAAIIQDISEATANFGQTSLQKARRGTKS